MAYTYGIYFLSIDAITSKPQILNLGLFKMYSLPYSAYTIKDYENTFYSFWRMTSYLSEEHAFAFFIISTYLFIKTIETKRNIFLLLYSISIAITVSIHSAVGVTIVFIFLPIFIYSLLISKITFKFLLKGIFASLFAVIIGSSWMIQFAIYGLPEFIGKAAPFLDVLFHTKTRIQE
jgi:hypothetical protein